MPRLNKLYLSSLSLLNISCWIRSQSFVRRSKPVVSWNAIWNTMGLFRMVYWDFQALVHSTCRATPLHCVRFYIRRGRVLRKALPVRKEVSPPCLLQTSYIFFMLCYIITVKSQWTQWCFKHQPHDCILMGLFRRRLNKTLKFRVTGLCGGNSPVNSPHKGPVTWKMNPFDDVIMVDLMVTRIMPLSIASMIFPSRYRTTSIQHYGVFSLPLRFATTT